MQRAEMARLRGEPQNKILILTTMESPIGAPMAALRLAAGLSSSGWQTQVVFLYHRDSMISPEHPYRVLLPYPPTRLRHYLKIYMELYDTLRTERPTALIGFLPLAAVLGAVAGRICRVRVRVVAHRVGFDTYSGAMQIADLFAAWSGLFTDVTAVSKSVARSCAKYPKRLRVRLRVIYNGLRDWVPSSREKTVAARSFGLPEEAFLLVSVGRLEPQKNYVFLLRVLASTDIPCFLAIAGGGSQRCELETLAAELGVTKRVRFLGLVPRDRIPDLLSAADLFVQPSLFEGQSNALLEAMEAGIPCFVGEVPEQVETVQAANGRVAGQILPMNDPIVWAAAIMDTCRKPETLKEMRETAVSQAKLFTFDRMVQGFDRLLSDAIAR